MPISYAIRKQSLSKLHHCYCSEQAVVPVVSLKSLLLELDESNIYFCFPDFWSVWTLSLFAPLSWVDLSLVMRADENVGPGPFWGKQQRASHSCADIIIGAQVPYKISLEKSA